MYVYIYAYTYLWLLLYYESNSVNVSISGPPHLRARSDPPKQTIHQAVDDSADGISPDRGSLGWKDLKKHPSSAIPCFFSQNSKVFFHVKW